MPGIGNSLAEAQRQPTLSVAYSLPWWLMVSVYTMTMSLDIILQGQTKVEGSIWRAFSVQAAVWIMGKCPRMTPEVRLLLTSECVVSNTRSRLPGPELSLGVHGF